MDLGLLFYQPPAKVDGAWWSGSGLCASKSQESAHSPLESRHHLKETPLVSAGKSHTVKEPQTVQITVI